MLRSDFENRWGVLADELADALAHDEADLKNEKLRYWSYRFEDLLAEAFWEVFEEGKRTLERDPSCFANQTLLSWCLGANGNSWVLSEVENHFNWETYLRDLERYTRTELHPEDFAYRPVSQLCLAELSTWRRRDPAIRIMLSQLHPHLTAAVESVLAGESCATLEEAVERFPVLKGLTIEELTRHRRNRGLAVVEAARELLRVRTKHCLEETTLDRYFRPKPFVRK